MSRDRILERRTMFVAATVALGACKRSSDMAITADDSGTATRGTTEDTTTTVTPGATSVPYTPSPCLTMAPPGYKPGPPPLAVEVHDPNGKPMKGVSVFRDGRPMGQTGSNGMRFVYDQQPATLVVECPDGARSTVTVTPDAGHAVVVCRGDGG